MTDATMKPWETRSSADAPAHMGTESALAFAEGYNAALTSLDNLYTVAATGGLEIPSFFSTRSRSEAQTKFDEWAADRMHGDRVDLLSTTLDGKTTVIDSAEDDDPFDEDDLEFLATEDRTVVSPDSAGRWCAKCNKHGSHHTDKHDEFVGA